MKTVAVLGTGPAGLMAAWAVAQRGHAITMFGSVDEETGNVAKSKIGGAQFLHRPIPGAPAEKSEVRIEFHGDADTYQRKVYGDQKVPFVSFVNLQPQRRAAWQLQQVYEWLWEELSCDKANVLDVTPDWLDAAKKAGWFDAVISAVPAPAICRSVHAMPDATVVHQFRHQDIQVLDRSMLYSPADGNVVHYDGTEDRSWTRTSMLFGHGGTEWSIPREAMMLEEDDKVITLTKPIGTNCDCYPDVMRVGRMGTWTKGVLADSAFYEVRDALH